MVSLITPAKPVVKPQPKPPEPLPLITAPVEAPSPSPILAPPPPPPEPAPVAAAPEAAITAPIFAADYLDNPPPMYPTLSRRVGEQGRVVLRVLVNPEGRADDVEIRSSSGHFRLDEAARETVRRWRFVPAKRGDQPVPAWVLIPISFRLAG
jgi:protein TonB